MTTEHDANSDFDTRLPPNRVTPNLDATDCDPLELIPPDLGAQMIF